MQLNPGQILTYPSQLVRHEFHRWRAWLTTPAHGWVLGPIRLILGLLMCWNWLNIALDFTDWFGPAGWLPAADAIALRKSTLPWGWSLWDMVPQSAVKPLFAAGFLVIIAWSSGLRCRYTGPIVWLLHYSTMRRLPIMLFGFDSVMGTFLLYLAVTGTGGQSLTVEKFLPERFRSCDASQTATVRARVALCLLQLHLCVIYGAAGLSKLLGEPWWTGTASYFLVANTEFRGVSILESLGESRPLMALATFVPLWTEILYPVLVWNRRWRPIVLFFTIGMHLTIATTLGLWEFSLAMIAANLVFVEYQKKSDLRPSFTLPARSL